jgi:hypothetical protein
MNSTKFIILPVEAPNDENFQSYIIFIKNCFLICGITISGITISIIVIANILFSNISREYKSSHGYDSSSDDDDDDDEEDELPFEEQYIEEYNNLDTREIEDDELVTFKNKFIEEKEYSRGLVNLAYDKDNTAFIYYSNTKDIPYAHLEAIARRYVINYDCKQILIDTKSEYTKATDLCKKEQEEEDERNAQTEIEKMTKQVSVFATFKKYTKESLTRSTVKKVPLMDKTNRYIYKGNMIDFEELLNARVDLEEFEQLDYSTFKKLTASDSEKKTL